MIPAMKSIRGNVLAAVFGVTVSAGVGCGVNRPFLYNEDLPGYAYVTRNFPVAWHRGPIEVTLGRLAAKSSPPRAHALLIHGLGENENSFLPLANRLAAIGIEVTALRLPDCALTPGGNPAAETGWTKIEQMAAVVLRVIQSSDPPPDLFWGRGLGGAILYRAAKDFPVPFNQGRAVVFESPIFAAEARFQLKLLDAERVRIRDGRGQGYFAQQLGPAIHHNGFTADLMRHLVPGYTSEEGYIRQVDAVTDSSNRLRKVDDFWWARSIWVLAEQDSYVSCGALMTRLRLEGIPSRRILTYQANHFVSLTQDVWTDATGLVFEK
jgi:pimeloyl-ACP methyl ester carboxylesterase